MTTVKIGNLEIDASLIKGYECKHVVYIPPLNGNTNDIHFVKEQVHLTDGRIIPNKRKIVNFKRPFWITHEGRRNHKDKKEHEEISNVRKYMSRQCDLPRNVARALGVYSDNPQLRELSKSPYLYGSDVLSTTIIKHLYQTKNKECISPSNVAGFDVETDVIGVYSPYEEVSMASLTFRDRAFTAVVRGCIKGLPNYEILAKECAKKHLAEEFKTRNIDWNIVIVDNPADAIIEVFKKAHEWMPDIVEIWNMDFDIPKCVEVLKRYGHDPKDVFSDPSLHPSERFFEYVQGKKTKVTASGKQTPIKPADQWHTVYTPASFYIVDGMCVYRKLRVAAGEEPSYSLDSILEKEKLPLKLRIVPEADKYSKLNWHIFMQTNHMVEYGVYHLADCIRMEQLDEKITDLRLAFPSQVGHSDFHDFKSQPRRTVDDLHFFVLEEKGLVYGSTGRDMKSEFDDDTIGCEDWINVLCYLSYVIVIASCKKGIQSANRGKFQISII